MDGGPSRTALVALGVVATLSILLVAGMPAGPAQPASTGSPAAPAVTASEHLDDAGTSAAPPLQSGQSVPRSFQGSQSGANFAVTNVSANSSPVLEGSTVQVNATIENTGDASAERTVSLDVSDQSDPDLETVDSTTVTLGAGNETTIALNWSTEAGDAGDYSAFVDATDDSNGTVLRVDAPTNVSVDTLTTASPVLENETLAVDATLGNDGDRDGTRTVNLSVDGVVRDSQSVTVDAHDAATVTLEWETGADDAGNYTATVRAANDTASASVAVDTPANVSVASVTANESVVANETVVVDATLENVGDRAGERTVSLNVSDGVGIVASATRQIGGGENESVSLEWDTTGIDGDTYELSVETANASNATDVRVDEPATFSVHSVTATSPVLQNGTLGVNATVENVGDRNGTQTIHLSVNGTERATESLTLDASESANVTLEWPTSVGDAGNYTATVASGNATASTPVWVQAPAQFAVTGIDANAIVTEGESLTLNATVENVGDVQGTETINVTVGNDTVNSTNVTIGAGNVSSVTFTRTPDAVGTFEYGIEAAHDANATNVTIEASDDGGSDGGSGGGGGVAPVPSTEPSPDFTIGAVELQTDTVGAGESVAVDVEIENDGDADGEYAATLTANGEPVDSGTVSVSANLEETLTLATSFDQPGTYQLALDGESVGNVTVAGTEGGVSATADLDVADVTVSETEVDPGTTATISTTVTNHGSAEGSREIEFAVDGEPMETRSLTLEANDSETVTFEHAFETPGSHPVSLEGGRVATVTVRSSESPNEDDGADSGDEVPGFGALAGFVGLVLGGLLAARRTAR